MKITSYINEIKIKQSLHRVTMISVTSLCILLVFAFATFKIVSYVFNASQASDLQATVSEYASNIKRKSQSDLQTLRSIALFTQNAEDIISSFSLKATGNREAYPFEVVGFWNLDGSCQQVSITGVRTDSHYRNLPPQVKVAISSAWLGHSTVSAPYYSKTIGKDMVTYVTPIISKDTGEVIAALSGAVNQDTFENVLSQLSNAHHGVDTFLATSSGFIFATGINHIIPSGVDNLIDINGIPEETNDLIKVSLVSTDPVSSDFKIGDTNYRITITPLGFSDWYLCTLCNTDRSNSPYFQSMLYLIGIISAIFAVCVFVAFYLFFSMKSSFKTQLLIAHYDPITEGYNLPKFLLEFDSLDYRDSEEVRYAVATLNIHDFNYITEMLGEQQSETLLKTIAGILDEREDVVMYCRKEAAQFFILFRLHTQEELDRAIRSIMEISESEISCNVSSIPVVMYSGVVFAYPTLTPDKLVARAEFAAKQIVKTFTHAVRFYDENAYKKESFLRAIEKNMREALANGEFKLFLQPKIDLKTGKISAAEALVRWISDSDSIIYPNDFIPLFENNGFCTELDLYMFEKVCQKLRFYLDNGIEPIYFSINQTKLLIFQKGYTDKLRRMLTKYNVPPKYIVIEVLEDLATHNVNELNLHIKDLKSVGLSIALDDFGSGYSSLNIVTRLAIDEIKFDREFLMTDDPENLEKNKMILKVLSQLSKVFGMRTVVEGVERHSDVEFLKTIDCDLAQGYYFDRPISDTAFDEKYIFTDGVTATKPAPSVRTEQEEKYSHLLRSSEDEEDDKKSKEVLKNEATQRGFNRPFEK